MDLSGKKFVVTGGSRGIGKDIVKQASLAGARVLFTYNSGEDRAREVLKATRSSEFTSLDLADRSSIGDFLFKIASESIDYFVANAGIEFSGSLKKHNPDEIQRVIDSNLTGNLYLLQSLVADDLMNSGGQIAVVGSIAADGNHDQFAYSASKSGLRGAIESLSRYDSMVKGQGLGVKLLEPAFVRTPMTERVLKLLERRVIPAKGGDDLVERFRNEKIVMDPEYAAGEILRMTIDPGVTGVRTIPEGVNLHQIRETYFGS